MSGWVIDDSRELAFILIILSFIPLWLTGWASLSLIKWEKLCVRLISKIIQLYQKYIGKNVNKPVPVPAAMPKPVIKRKKSYKEIRPRSLIAPLSGNNESPSAPLSSINPAPRPLPNAKPIITPSVTPPTSGSSILEHSLFKFDDEEDDFALSFDDLDKIESTPPPAPHADPKPQQPRNLDKRNDRDGKKETPSAERGNKQRGGEKDSSRKNNKPLPMSGQPQSTKNSGNSSLEIIKQKGYQVITSATIKNNFVDFIGIADGQICICLVDKESGDWLADEERFNDEEPLWFSENSHRISPVRRADIVQNYLTEKLKENGFDYAISTFVIIQYGNIINAEDMFETWQNMHINVTRIDRGMPRELKLFAKSLEDADKGIDIERFEKIKKIVRNLT